MTDYPEHEKQAKVLDDAETLQHFVDRMEQKGYRICKLQESGYSKMDDEPIKEWWPVDNYNALFAEYFEIDLDKITAEKEAMFQTLRATSKKETPPPAPSTNKVKWKKGGRYSEDGRFMIQGAKIWMGDGYDREYRLHEAKTPPGPPYDRGVGIFNTPQEARNKAQRIVDGKA